MSDGVKSKSGNDNDDDSDQIKFLLTVTVCICVIVVQIILAFFLWSSWNCWNCFCGLNKNVSPRCQLTRPALEPPTASPQIHSAHSASTRRSGGPRGNQFEPVKDKFPLALKASLVCSKLGRLCEK